MSTTEQPTQQGQIVVGARVRERYVPAGCEAWRGTVLFVAPDGWVGVKLTGLPRSMSVPPYEVELDQRVD